MNLYPIHRSAVALIAAAFLFGCTTQSGFSGKPQSGQCTAGSFTLTSDFSGARLGECRVLSENSVRLLNSPEDQPINHSPWYAFKVSEGVGRLKVRIDYEIHKHRYWPKVSKDGRNWRRLPEDRVQLVNDDRSVEFWLDIDGTPFWVSGQELLDEAWYEQWYSEIQAQGFGIEEIGSSIEGRPIKAFQTNPGARETILLLGRQHPPEVTGALAMRYFVDRLLEGRAGTCGDRQGLCEFFQRYNIFVAPFLNPDGVARGHWRHNLGSKDLNRDWGIFSQPETQAVINAIKDLIEQGAEPVLMLDFHSTARNLFYTQSDEEEAIHNGFATRWLNLASRKPGIYNFTQEKRHNSGQPTSRNFFYVDYGIPSLTYEAGDETDRQAIANSAHIFADTLVTLLMSSDQQD